MSRRARAVVTLTTTVVVLYVVALGTTYVWPDDGQSRSGLMLAAAIGITSGLAVVVLALIVVPLVADWIERGHD